ncbi:hypothetical protein BGW38_008883 [Lunasporangiospora selenospora]|uniref:EF-hand domain-containing protein n=1 Tax=Lunasporangiospora selenospora TaxID=979761 RepID=A0A9P6FY67_9FUNG|nr:hypothetical protein BGW38_008883 [Lunasporangiospora selenospora]
MGAIPEKEKERIRGEFNKYDKDSDGRITLDEFEHLVKDLGGNAEPNQVSSILKNFDLNKNGHLDFDEFFAILTVLESGQL